MRGELTPYPIFMVQETINLVDLKISTIMAYVSHANQQKREIIYCGGVIGHILVQIRSR